MVASVMSEASRRRNKSSSASPTRWRGRGAAAEQRLHATLREAEREQVESWLRKQHAGIDRTLGVTAERLSTGAISPPRQGIRSATIALPSGLSTEGSGLHHPVRDGKRISLVASYPGKRQPVPEVDLGDSDLFPYVNSPTRGFSTRVGSANADDDYDDSLPARVRHAVKREGFTAKEVRDFFLPPEVMAPDDHCIRLREALEVMSIDLGVSPRPGDEATMLNVYGMGGDLLDARDLLAHCGLWSDDVHNHASRGIEDDSVQVTAPSPLWSDDGEGVHLRRRDNGAHTGTRQDVAARSIQMSYRRHVARRSRHKKPRLAEMQPKTDPAPSSLKLQPDSQKEMAQHARGVTESESLQKENERLRRELDAFDLGFFEELEDLKYSYTKLKSAASEMAKQQGVDLSTKLGLPSGDDEPWGHSIDIARESVDWEAASPSPVRGGSAWGSPVPRGAYVRRLERQWAGLGGEALSQSDPGHSRGRSRNRKHRSRRPGAGVGVVAAHERKLAWEVSSGGMNCLNTLRDWISKLDHDGNGLLTAGQLSSALRESGYAMDAHDIQVLKTGLGMTESGLLEAGEFLYMVEDMAAQNEWYTDATVATIDGLARGSIALGLDGDGGEPLRRSGDIGYLAGTTFGVETHLPPPASLESAMAETRQQLALIDLASLSEGFGCTLSDGISMPFRRRDPMSTGLLAARDVDLALGELGVILKPDEFAMVARKFAYKPGSSEQERGDSRMHDVERATAKSVRGALVNSQGSSAPPPRVSYPLLVRWIIDTVCEERGIDPAVGARMNMGAQGKWYERLSEIARRLRKAVCKTGLENRKGWIEALKRRFEEFDMDDNGQLGRREFMRVLSLSGIDLSDAESKALMAHLDSNHDGSVSWQEFIEFFSSDGELRLGDDNAPIVKEPWYAIATDVAERLLDVMRSKGSAVSQRAWLGTLRRALDEADADGSGSLSKGELSKCLSAVGIKMDPLDLERLHRAIDEDGNGEVSYAELTSFLRRHASQWHLAEAEVAAKIVRAMGTGNLSRRTWLTRLRKQFFSSDSFRSGVMGASDLLRVLREMGVDLTRGEEARLLDALEGEPSAVDDADGGVAYGELLAFCARHAGKWHEAHPDLADRLREAMKQRAHSASDLRRLFRQFDVDGNGTIDATEFELALRRLGLSDLTLAEKGILMDAVDSNGTGAIAYGELIAFYTSSEPWHRSNKDLTERLARALEGSGPSGGALRELRMRFREADRLGAGSITRKQFQDVLRSLPGTRALDPSEVDRLMGCLDSDGDGRVSYRELLGFIAGHMGSWESRLPDIASDLSFQLNRSPYGRAATVQNLERRIKIADPDETGRLGPLSLGRCLRSVGLGLNENQLMQLVGAMDTHGDGRVPIGPLLDFLVHHASPDSRSPSDPAAEQLAHKFREIVWTEVKREGGSRKNWHAGLRHVFDRHLDVDGDGFITLPDLRTALPELGIRCDAPDIRPLFTMMESRQDLGQVSFRDFSDFMLGAEGFSSTSTVRRRSYTSSLALQAERQARPFVCRHAVSGDEERRRGSSQGHAPYAWVKQSESGRQVKLALKLLGQTQTSLQQARRAFTSLDPGRTGRLSPMKAKVALSEMGLDASKVRREDWQNLMQSLDQDSHGNIFYQDLLDVLFGAVTHSAADEMEDHAPHPRIAPEPHPQTRRRTSVRGVAILNAERVITLRRDILSDLEASVGKNAAAERAVSRALESFSGKSTTIRNNRAHSSRAEIKKSLARCGVRLDATQESDLFTKLDPDCRGSIGREDFLAFLFHPESGLSSVMEARRSNQSHTDERRAVPESDFEAKVRRELRPQAKAVEDLIKILAKGRSRVLSERDLRHAVRQAGLNISTSGLSFIVRKTKGNSERGVSTQSLVDFFRQPRRSTPADEMEVLASLRAHGGGRRPSTASAGGVHSSRRAAVPQDRRVSSELLISGRPLH